jgi:uncharacterized protein
MSDEATGEAWVTFQMRQCGRPSVVSRYTQPWCMGFLTGMRLRQQNWNPLLDLSRMDHGLMLPILLYCTDPLGCPILGPPREGPETEEFLRTAYHDIAVVIPAIRDYWMPQRVVAAKNQS